MRRIADPALALAGCKVAEAARLGREDAAGHEAAAWAGRHRSDGDPIDARGRPRDLHDDLARALAAEPDIEVIDASGTSREALRWAAAHHPDVVLVDFELADGSAVEAAGQVKRDSPHAAVLMLTGQVDEQASWMRSRRAAPAVSRGTTPCAT